MSVSQIMLETLTALDGSIKDIIITFCANHSCVKYIKENLACTCNTTFFFKEVTQEEVYCRLKKFNGNKSAVFEQIPPKMKAVHLNLAGRLVGSSKYV